MRRGLAAAVVLFALGCAEDVQEAAAPEGGITFEVVPPPIGEQSQLFAEGVPLAAEVSPVPETPPVSTPAPRPAREPGSRDAAAANVSPEKRVAQPEPHVPLDSLLRTPGVATAPSPTLDLQDEAKPSDARKPGALDAWKERVRLQRRSEAIGHAGPRQGTVSRTEAGLRVPVDDAVSLEGGVRVESRDEPGLEEPERSSIPRVGVEVRF